MKRAAWKWYACLEGESDECAYESDTREQTLAAISADFPAGTVVEVMEARFSTDQRYEGRDFVPFIAVRNAAKVTLGTADVIGGAA